MSSSDEDRPPPLPGPARDPLLDDPAFAELVGPPTTVVKEPLYAEPVEMPEAFELPVAEVIPVALPKAVPIPPAASIPPAVPIPPVAPVVPRYPTPNFPTRKPEDIAAEPPKPQWIAACGVLGCVGFLMIACFAVLIYIAITLLSNIGDKVGDTKPTSRTDSKLKVQPGPVAKTTLEKDVELALDGAVDDVGIGGRGRFLLLGIPRKKEIHVLDVNNGEIVHRIPVGEEKVLFAAGASKLYAIGALNRKLVKYDLYSGANEMEVDLSKPLQHVRGLAVGSGVDSPLYAITGMPGRAITVHPLDSTATRVNGSFAFEKFHVRTDEIVRARSSADGTIIGLAATEGAIAVRVGNGATATLLTANTGANPAWATPSEDGKFLYTPRGAFDPDGKSLFGTGNRLYFFPTAQGSTRFLQLDRNGEEVMGVPALRVVGTQPLAKRFELAEGELKGSFPANEFTRSSLTAADRIQYWPEAGLLVVIPQDGKNLLQLFKVPLPVD